MGEHEQQSKPRASTRLSAQFGVWQYTVARVLTIGLLLGLWAWITEANFVKPLFLPSPHDVIQSALTIGKDLSAHVVSTFLRTTISFVLGASLGIAIGLAMAYSRYIAAIIDPIIESMRPVPPVAVVPFFILWFGFSDYGKVLLVLLGTMVVMAVQTYEAVLRVRPIYIRAALCFGASRSQLFQRVVSRAILPALTPGLRIAMALAITLVIVSEFMGARTGLGHLINVAKATTNTALLLLCTIILGAISILLDWAIRGIMRRLSAWSERFDDAVTSGTIGFPGRSHD